MDAGTIKGLILLAAVLSPFIFLISRMGKVLCPTCHKPGKPTPTVLLHREMYICRGGHGIFDQGGFFS